MNLQTIDQRLWAAVQSSYEGGNYTGAILDSIYFLSDLIRNKSGLDSDGQTLVGSAFGGQDPIIKVNSMQTESDRDEQKGLEFLLRGIYTAIRNPRSHEKRSDSLETADTLVTFINYVITLIDKSRSPYDTEQLISRVFDKDFAQTKKYAELLACRVPARKRLDLLMQVFRRRHEGNTKNIAFFADAILETLSEEGKTLFWQAVSDALESAQTDADYRTAIQITREHWPKLSELARLRTEHRLIQSIKEGAYDAEHSACTAGSLGTWALTVGLNFSMKVEIADSLISKLSSQEPDSLKLCVQVLHWLPSQPQTHAAFESHPRIAP